MTLNSVPSPAKDYFIAYHIGRGDLVSAALVAKFPESYFLDMDALMRAAWLVGASEATKRLHPEKTPLQPQGVVQPG